MPEGKLARSPDSKCSHMSATPRRASPSMGSDSDHLPGMNMQIELKATEPDEEADPKEEL